MKSPPLCFSVNVIFIIKRAGLNLREALTLYLKGPHEVRVSSASIIIYIQGTTRPLRGPRSFFKTLFSQFIPYAHTHLQINVILG